jgi:dUTP pyrophosphatase
MEAFIEAAEKKHLDYIMILTLYTEVEDLQLKYNEVIQSHNNKFIQHNYHDSGFDLFTPQMNNYRNDDGKISINYQIKCRAQMYSLITKQFSNTSYYLYPRSSITKTCYRLANSVGIIDSGYRGNLIGVFDCNMYHATNDSNLPYSRLLQICAPNLCPIYCHLANSMDELGPITERMENGFGSSGV